MINRPYSEKQSYIARSQELRYWSLRLTFIVTICSVLWACNEETVSFDPHDVPSTEGMNLALYSNADSLIKVFDNISNVQERLDSLLFYTEMLRNNERDVAMAFAEEAYRSGVR